MLIEFERIQKIIAESSYKSNGAITEREYEHYLSNEFSNSEVFWKSFIIPFTNRICSTLNPSQEFTRPREGVSQDLHEIGSFHYSIFLNLIYAHETINARHFSFFENFYMHLGSVCDLVEEFLIKIYFLVLECKEVESKILKKLSKEEFLKISSEWYEKNYETLYEQYFKNGKTNPIRLPNRKYILDEYFDKSDSWTAYKKFSQGIRQYRNIIVHHYKVAFLQDEKGNIYVPKKDKISKYKKWLDVENAIQDPNKHNDFTLQDVQMLQDITELKIVLQNLWEKPINDINDLLFINKNNLLLKKYNIEFE